MILTLWLALLALAVVVCVLGYFTGDEPYLTVGLFIMFLLSIVIITGDLEYETGAVTSTNYTYSGDAVVSTDTAIDYNYAEWNDSMSQKVGWVMGIISGIGIALSLYNTKKRGIERA